VKTIHHVVDIDADGNTVWGALTTQVGLASWWTTSVAAPGPAVGSNIEFTFGGDFNPIMEITQLEANGLLGWKCVGGHLYWADNTFRFELAQPDDGKTRLRFWQEYATELDDDAYGIYNYNWGYYLESLRLFCNDGKGKPFAPE
jgi:uncharacterized protein YndB with AHSA1/START domain